jgi:hypothetical protein
VAVTVQLAKAELTTEATVDLVVVLLGLELVELQHQGKAMRVVMDLVPVVITGLAAVAVLAQVVRREPQQPEETGVLGLHHQLQAHQ